MALTPGRGFDNSRLADTEARADRLQPNLSPRHSRDAQPPPRRNGRHRGITVDEIAHGSFGTVKLVYWNGTGYTVAKDADVEDITIEAGWYLGNTTDPIPADTAVTVQFYYDNTWEIDNGWCAARDWDLQEEEE